MEPGVAPRRGRRGDSPEGLPLPVWGVRQGQMRVSVKRCRPPGTKVKSWFLREMAQNNTQGSDGSPTWTLESQSPPLVFPPLATDNCPPLPHVWGIFQHLFRRTTRKEQQLPMGPTPRCRWQRWEGTGSWADRGPRPRQPGGAGGQRRAEKQARTSVGPAQPGNLLLQESVSSKQTC